MHLLQASSGSSYTADTSLLSADIFRSLRNTEILDTHGVMLSSGSYESAMASSPLTLYPHLLEGGTWRYNAEREHCSQMSVFMKS